MSDDMTCACCPGVNCDDLGLDHLFVPHPDLSRFCVFPLHDGPCGWGDWLHPTTIEGETV